MKAENRKLSDLFRFTRSALAGHMARAGLLLTALPIVVDKLDAIPEAHRSLYVEKDGKFNLDLEGYEDPVGLKSALQKERTAAANASKQVSAWAALGKTPEEIKALVDAAAQAEIDKLGKAGEWDKLKAQMLTSHQGELTKKDEAIASSQRALSKYLVDSAAATALAAAKGSVPLLLPHIQAAVKVVADGDNYSVRVMGKDGNPRVDGKGEFLTIDDLVSEMRQSDEFGRAFDATGTSGGGAQGGGGGGGSKTMKQAAFDALRPKERAQKMAEGYTLVP